MTYTLSKTTRAVLRSLVPVICPPEAAPLTEAILDHMTLTFGAMPPLVNKATETGLVAYDLGALPRYRMRARALAPDAATAYYATWEHGVTPLHRQFARILNQLMSLSCYEQPAMMEAIGYRVGPWIEEVKKKRLIVFADAIAKQDAAILAPDPLRRARGIKKEVA